MVMEMGNAKARAAYEANLPENFRRPQTDMSLEQFIRQKYEQRKYVAADWQPPRAQVRTDLLEGSGASTTAAGRLEKPPSARPRRAAAPAAVGGVAPSSDFVTPAATPRPAAQTSANPAPALHVPAAAAQKPQTQGDLLVSFDEVAPHAHSSARSQPNLLVDDLFGDLVSAAPQPQPQLQSQPVAEQQAPRFATSVSANDLHSVFGAQNSSQTQPNFATAFSPMTPTFNTANSTNGANGNEAASGMSTSAILALYGASQPRMYAQPGMPMMQQQFAGVNMGMPQTQYAMQAQISRPNPFGLGMGMQPQAQPQQQPYGVPMGVSPAPQNQNNLLDFGFPQKAANPASSPAATNNLWH